MYINDLILALGSSEIGCHIRGVFAGSVPYANDILLLPSSLIKLQIMMDICNDFAYLADLTFNSKKSVRYEIGALCENATKFQFFWDQTE